MRKDKHPPASQQTPTQESKSPQQPQPAPSHPQPRQTPPHQQPTQPSEEQQLQAKYWFKGCRVAMKKSEIYHEKQSAQHCAVHTINNILQEQVYTNKHFDKIAAEMGNNSEAKSGWSPFNQHKSSLGNGNYDANVLLYALGVQSGLNTTWYNPHKQDLAKLNTNKLVGVIINVISTSFLWWETRHWLPLVPIYCPFDEAEQENIHKNGSYRSVNPSLQDQSKYQQYWMNLNPCLDYPDSIQLIPYLQKLHKRDKDAITIFVLAPGVEPKDLFSPTPSIPQTTTEPITPPTATAVAATTTTSTTTTPLPSSQPQQQQQQQQEFAPSQQPDQSHQEQRPLEQFNASSDQNDDDDDDDDDEIPPPDIQ